VKKQSGRHFLERAAIHSLVCPYGENYPSTSDFRWIPASNSPEPAVLGRRVTFDSRAPLLPPNAAAAAPKAPSRGCRSGEAPLWCGGGPGGVGCLRLSARCPGTSAPCLQISVRVYGRLSAEGSAQAAQAGVPSQHSAALLPRLPTEARPFPLFLWRKEVARPERATVPRRGRAGESQHLWPGNPHLQRCAEGKFSETPKHAFPLFFSPLFPGNHKKYTDYKRSFNSERAQG